MVSMKNLLKNITSPEDLKKIPAESMDELCREIRDRIITVVAKNGGHLAPNLGVVELTAALLRVFSPPKDKIIWDVGHQSYVYKLLTGRNKDFDRIRLYNGLSGFSLPSESMYDAFVSGHAGTSISVAMGYAIERDLRDGDDRVIAIIGDGSLGNGMAYEAMNNVRANCKRLIIILNDNKMSISKSVGAVGNYLNRIITGKCYNHIKGLLRSAFRSLPKGKNLVEHVQHLEKTAKHYLVPGLFFEEMGLRYVGPIDGHDLPKLESILRSVKTFDQPVLVHVVTSKGQGCSYAKKSPEKYHSVSGFDLKTGELKKSAIPGFASAFGSALVEEAKQNDNIVAITAAMSAGTGLELFEKTFPRRFFDVGIAEGHALTLAAGLAAAGKRPVVAIYATFLQRAMDSVFHDICLPKLPVVICVDHSGFVEDGPTHHGFYDLAFLQSLPDLKIMMPCSGSELSKMLNLALKSDGPVVIRYAKKALVLEEEPGGALVLGKSDRLADGKDLALWAVGRETAVAREMRTILMEKYQLSVRVVNARFLSPFDREALVEDAKKMPVFTLENMVSGIGLSKVVDETLVNIEHHGVWHFCWSEMEACSHGAESDIRNKYGKTAEGLSLKIVEKIKEAKDRKENG